MKSDNNRISVRQSYILTALYVFCSAIVLMPPFCISGAGIAGCISSLGAGILTLIPLYLIYRLNKNYKNGSFYEMLASVSNNITANILFFLFVVKTVLLTALMLKLFSQTMQIFLLPKTHLWVTSFVMLMLCAYIASKGIEARGRLSEILIFLIGVPFVLVFAAACFSIKPENIAEMITVSPTDIVKTGLISFLSFASVDFVLLHLPYCAEKTKSAKKIFISVPIAAIVSALAIFIAAACFGAYASSKQTALIPEIMNVIKLPATLIERHDLLNMFFWILILFHIISTYIFFACTALKDTLKKYTHPRCLIMLIPFMYVLTFVPVETEKIYILTGIINAASNVVTIILTAIMLIVNKEGKNG